jgi:hypothetical protein
MQVMEEGKGRKHSICFGAERARVSAVSTATSGDEDGVGSGKERAEGPTFGTGAAIRSKEQRLSVQQV